MKSIFRRQFWLTLFLFVALTAMAYTLSRFASAYIRVGFLRNQAQFFSDMIAAHPGDKIGFAREMQKKANALHIPLDLELRGATGSRIEPVIEPSTVVTPGNGESVRLSLGPDVGDLTVTMRPSPTIPLNVAVTFAALFLGLVAASALSVVLLYSHFREKAALAKSVFGRIQRGDLKARFPTSSWDEVSQVLLLFNDMAAEIERLVDQLKQKEQVRVQLLQELTHDLRTPVSSLRNLVESLRFSGADHDAEARHELTDLAYQETEYLTRLVEDLLFLALVFEPKYKTESSTVDLRELLSLSIAAVHKSYPAIHCDLAGGPPCLVTGNPQQLRRLLRNALDNAFSFAQKQVRVEIVDRGPELRLIISDDGPGFSIDSLKSFGHKRATRYQTSKEKDRLSVGLGSVIMSAIVNSHGGSLVVENQAADNGAVAGSRLTISLMETPGRA